MKSQEQLKKVAYEAVEKAKKYPTIDNIEWAQHTINYLHRETIEDRKFIILLQAQLDTIHNQAKPHFVNTPETEQTITYGLHPEIQLLPDQKKVAGGILGLDIGILELGLISSEQINRVSDSHRHQIIVPKGHTLDGQVEVAIRAVLGGHAFKVHIYKKQEDGKYKKVQVLEESSGSFLFIGKVAKMPFQTLDEGEYEFILETGPGLSVVQVIPYHLTNLTLKDYTEAKRQKLMVQGNLLKGQEVGIGNRAVITKVNDQQINQAQIIQGRYGQLYIKESGEYTYVPVLNPENRGRTEIFSFEIKNTKTKYSTKGDLKIHLK